ncbi:hypothetical protein CK203_057845 [Vitis vinifera]|uniref:Retrovirus-related Pol polyprotein from transposon TNT 1-94 n=1 Tax=Vitis vinifera TaxID=29760 RepID=A0A438GFP7_VITVI|nr:hypothetical protein CK203_057845 [Vitis vinifera]
MVSEEELMELGSLMIEEDFSVATLLNEFNMIVNQLSSVEINFNDEAHTLILLTSPPNSWEPKRATVNNSIDSAKLKFNDVKDQILIDKVRRIDLGKASTSSSALNIKRQLDEERHNVTFTNGAWKVTKGVMVIAPENKTGTLYMTSSCRDMVSVINSNANSDLWHFRLKHE